MKKRLVVHIGVHKTGTTAIQQTLFQNASQLARHGILYPRYYEGAPDAASHGALAWEIEVKKVDFAKLRNWAESLAQTDAHTVILSAEDLSRLKNLEFLTCFRDFFDPEVIVYLRRQDTWVSSWYNQHSKWPYAQRLDQCTPNEFLAHLHEFHWINYFETLERWAKSVGKQHLHVRVLEKGQIQDPVADLCDFCGVDFVLEQTLTQRLNESLPAEHVMILRGLGIRHYSPSMRLLITRAARKVPVSPGADVYPKAIRRMILDRYKFGNGMVAEHYLGRKDRILFRDDDIPDSPACPEEPDQEQLYCFARGLIEEFCAEAKHD